MQQAVWHALRARQDRQWQEIRLPAALLSVAAHVAIVGGGIWLAANATGPVSAPAVQVVRVSLFQQQAAAPVLEAPVEAPPKPKPKPKPPRRELKPKPIPEPIEQSPAEVAEERPAQPMEQSSATAPAAVADKDAAPEAEEALVEPPQPADYLRNPHPIYPRISRRLGEQGEVLLRVQVSPQGKPLQVILQESSGYERLDRAALEVVERWQFVPARRGSRAVEGWVIVPIVFRLGG